MAANGEYKGEVIKGGAGGTHPLHGWVCPLNSPEEPGLFPSSLGT